jgi:hypothetical protein
MTEATAVLPGSQQSSSVRAIARQTDGGAADQIFKTTVHTAPPVPSALIDAAFYPSKTDPVSLARDVARGFRAGAEAVVYACALLVAALEALAGSPEAISDFIKILVAENIIPRRSARLGDFDRSKLSMLRKIGENVPLLLTRD